MKYGLPTHQPLPDGTDEPSILSDLELYFRHHQPDYWHRNWLPDEFPSNKSLDILSPCALGEFRRSDLFVPLVTRVAQRFSQMHQHTLPTRLFLLAMLRLYLIYDIQTLSALFVSGLVALLMLMDYLVFTWFHLVAVILVTVSYRLYKFDRVCRGPTLDNDTLEKRICQRKQKFDLEPYEPESIWYIVSEKHCWNYRGRLHILLYIHELWYTRRLSRLELYCLRVYIPWYTLLYENPTRCFVSAICIWLYAVVVLACCRQWPYVRFGLLRCTVVFGIIFASLLCMKLYAILQMDRRRYVAATYDTSSAL